MVKFNKNKYFKLVAIILVILFVYQSDYFLCFGDDLQGQFEKAKDEYKDKYKNGKFGDLKLTLKRLIKAIAKSDKKNRKLLAKTYLLLGAAYEKTGKTKEAKKYYKESRKIWKQFRHYTLKQSDKRIIIKKCPTIEGIKFDKQELTYYRKYILEGKKKFPWPLVIGVVLVSTVAYFLFRKGGPINKGSAKLHIESTPPDAEVFIDSQSKGLYTPCDFSLKAGMHEIKLVNKDFGEAKKNIKIKHGKMYNINVKLSKYTYGLYDKWGSLGSGDKQFLYPRGIALDSNIYIYVVDSGNNRIQKFATNGNFIIKWGSKGSDNGEFENPIGIDVDGNGFVYVTDTDNNRVQKFDANGNFKRKWGSKGSVNGEFNLPFGIAIDKDNYLYIADTINNRIQKFDVIGKFIGKWGSYGSGNGKFDSPQGIAADSNGHVYVTEAYNNRRIQMFDSNGNFIKKWGEFGDSPEKFRNPLGIAVDSDGNVFLAANDGIRKYDPNGNLITQWGHFGNPSGRFRNPFGIAVDSNGLVYVADTDNCQIKIFEQSKTETENNGNWVINPSAPSNSRNTSSASKSFSPGKARKESSRKKDSKGKK